jgi:hypothetical protein
VTNAKRLRADHAQIKRYRWILISLVESESGCLA